MLSKFSMGLALSICLVAGTTAIAQDKKPTKAQTAAQKKAAQTKAQKEAAEAAKKAAEAKAQEEKALEEKRKQEADEAAKKAAEGNVFWNYLKTKFSVSYHGEYHFTRRVDDDVEIGATPSDENAKIQDLRIMHNPTIVYRPIQNWKVIATSEFKYTDAAAKGSFINRHYRSYVAVTRENVLTEKDNGVKLDLGVARRIFDVKAGSSYGNSRITSSMYKKINDNLTTSLAAIYLYNDPKPGRAGATTWRHSLELIPSFTYQITDKLSYFFNDDIVLNTPWNDNTADKINISHEMNIGVLSYQINDKNSFYYQLKYLHFAAAPFQEQVGNMDWFENYLGYTYAFTPKMSLTAELGTELFRGSDGRDGFSKKIEYPEFYMYFDWAL